MSEAPTSPADSEHILAIKDALHSQWEQLPSEHQASMALVLVGAVMVGEGGAWLREAIELRWPTEPETSPTLLPITGISRADLERVHLSEEDIAQLSDEDLKRISQQIEDHLVNDVFWQELEFAAQEVLQEKRDKG